jgi:hypothetical protein
VTVLTEVRVDRRAPVSFERARRGFEYDFSSGQHVDAIAHLESEIDPLLDEQDRPSMLPERK